MSSNLVIEIAKSLKARGWKLATAESCTGGGVAYHLTNLAGSSEWFERGFITYSNSAKEEMLGVRAATLSSHGAVSEATAREMAEGALRHSKAQISLAITGIAGPSGGTPDKPVGTIWFAWSGINIKTIAQKYLLHGDRITIREQAMVLALQKLLSLT